MYVGLGDTATHDCGLGMAYALGFRFYDAGGRELMPVGAMLSRLATVDAAFVPSTIRNLNCTALCDVMNPLLGSDGAALRFASQKGADSTTVMRLEDGGVRFAKIVSRDLGVEVATLAGAGAAGGLGAGLAAFLGARLVSGAETLLDVVGFDSMLQGCHAVITGEGRVDEKTLLGKGVAQVARRAAAHGVHCVIVAGSIEGEKEMLEEKLKATIILLHESRADAESTRLGIARASGVVRDALMNA
jgi:glycerate kinase